LANRFIAEIIEFHTGRLGEIRAFMEKAGARDFMLVLGSWPCSGLLPLPLLLLLSLVLRTPKG
jgi:hypothetical protein